jgi:hypothetical protein
LTNVSHQFAIFAETAPGCALNCATEERLGREAGPVVRPYALTKGRTLPASGAHIGLLDVVTIRDGIGPFLTIEEPNATPYPGNGSLPNLILLTRNVSATAFEPFIRH